MERIMVSVQNRVSRCTRRKKLSCVVIIHSCLGHYWSRFVCLFISWGSLWGTSDCSTVQGDHRLWSPLRMHPEAGLNEPKSIIRHAHHAKRREWETGLGFDPDREKTRCEQAPVEQCLSVSRRCWIARCWHLEDAVPGGWQRPGQEFHCDRRASQIQRQLWPASPSISFFSTIASVKLCLSKTCSTQLAVTHSANTLIPSSVLPSTIKDLLRPSYYIGHSSLILHVSLTLLSIKPQIVSPSESQQWALGKKRAGMKENIKMDKWTHPTEELGTLAGVIVLQEAEGLK